MLKDNCLNTRLYDIKKHLEIIELVLISIGLGLVPIIIPQLLTSVFGTTSVIASNSQFIVGAIVNCSLIVIGINVKGWKKIIGLVTLPSVVNLTSGFVFHTTSIFMMYMIPAIWIGNFILIYCYKKFFVEKKLNYLISSLIGIVLKVLVIFAGFNLLLALNIIPKGNPVAVMLTSAMGINQLITAILGSLVAFGILKCVYEQNEKIKG